MTLRYCVWLLVLCGSAFAESLIVYLPSEAAPSQFAFDELNHFLSHLSGQSVVRTEAADNGQILLIMADALPESLKNKIRVADAPESFHVRQITDGDTRRIVVCGRDDRGLLYGVYELIELYMARIQGSPLVDISFNFRAGSGKNVDLFSLEPDIRKTPFYKHRGLHLDFISLGAGAVLGIDPSQPRDKEVWRQWSDWCARHRLNFISSWPYGKTNWWELVSASVLPKATALTAEQIDRSIAIRRELLDYTTLRQVDTYLMNYVPGKGSPEMAAAYPYLFTENHEKNVSRFCYNQDDLWKFFTEVIENVSSTYPQMDGFNLRRWGESYPCECDYCKGRDTELSRQLLQKMIEAAVVVRTDLKLLLSGYMEPEYAAHFPDRVVCMIKWGNDWDPSPDPGRSAEYLKRYGSKEVIIDIALPCEESFPLGLIEHTYLDAGIKKYALQPKQYPNLKGFAAGFGDSNFGFLSELNYIVFSRLVREPENFDTQAFCRAYLNNKFGKAASGAILESLNIQAEVWSAFFCSKERGGLEFVSLAPYSNWARFGDLYTSFPNGGMKAFDHIQTQSVEVQKKSFEHVSLICDKQMKAYTLAALAALKAPLRNQAPMKDFVHQTGAYLSYLESRKSLLKAFIARHEGRYDMWKQHLKKTAASNQKLLGHLKAKPNNVGYGDQGGNIADWELKRLLEGIEDENARIVEFTKSSK